MRRINISTPAAAVSYTHLDVYKRQVQTNAERRQVMEAKSAEKEEAAPSVGGARAAAQPNMPKEAPSAQSVSSDAKPEPVRRETPKIGRNDLCPCGSGKKYKNCCGKNE